MKLLSTIFVMSLMVFGKCNGDTIPIYNTLNNPVTGYMYNINFPITQKFIVQQNSQISNITVGVPTKITPGRQLTVGFYDSGFNLIKSYSAPNSYYYNVDHFYSYNGELFNLSPGNYYLGIQMSNGPTGWAMTSGGMLGRIDAYCVPETKYTMALISLVLAGVVLYKWKPQDNNMTEL